MRRFRSILGSVEDALRDKKLSVAKREEKAYRILNEHYASCAVVFHQLESLRDLHKSYNQELYLFMRILSHRDSKRPQHIQLKQLKKLKELHMDRLLVIKEILKEEKFLE